MATPVRKSLRTRKTKRPASPSEDEERRKKKAQEQALAKSAAVTDSGNATKSSAKQTPRSSTKLTPKTTTKPSSKTKSSTTNARQTATNTSQGKSLQKTVTTPAPPVINVIQQKPVIPVCSAVVPPTITVPVAAPPVVAPPEVAKPSLVPKETIPTVASIEPVVTKTQPEYKVHCFKDPNFVHSSKGGAFTKKSRVWKTLKQITAAERSLPWKPTDPTYSSMEAPPSFKPAKKYSDISGFQAKYTDPHTKLRYATTEEFARLRLLPQDIVTGLLALRKANTEVP